MPAYKQVQGIQWTLLQTTKACPEVTFKALNVR